MGMMPGHNRSGPPRRAVLLLPLAAALASGLRAARAEDDEAARAARWKELRKALFGDRSFQDGTRIIRIDAPARAQDAALVPVGLTLPEDKKVAGVYLVIDQNPSPLAAHLSFGPKADPRELKLRVRVDQYTDIHGIMQTADGQLYEAARFVKAAGGCSAPAGADEVAALEGIGRMKLRLPGGFATDRPVEAVLMVRHPNFNGMQMNQVTRNYTPARFIRSIDVSYNGGQVFRMDSDISLSTDPVIGFRFVPGEPGSMVVRVTDSADANWERRFELPQSAA